MFSKKTHFKVPLLLSYTILFLFLCFFSILEFLINKKVFLVYDTLTEYVTSLAYLGEYLRGTFTDFIATGKLHLKQWDFTLGLGADIVSTLNWYVLGDPLTLLSVFVKKEYTIYLHYFLVIFRLYLTGLSFLYYCAYRKKDNFYSLCGAIVYIFSGYAMFLAFRHTYFINSFILLPLLYIGIEKILTEKKIVFFTVITFISCITNFYFFYILTILIFVYAFVRFFHLYRENRLSNFTRNFLITLFAYTLGVMMASVIFIPAAAGFLACGRSGFQLRCGLFYDLRYYLKLIIGIITPSYLASYTYLGFAPVFLPLLILCFIRKENKDLKIFAIIYSLFLCFPIIGSMFNGFNYVTNRWCFAVSFFAGFLTVEILPHIRTLSKKEIIFVLGIPLFLSLIVFAGFFVNEDIQNSCILSYIVLFFTVVLIFILNKFSTSEKKSKLIILLIICISVTVNSYERFSPDFINYVSKFFNRGDSYAFTYGTADSIVKNIKDASFWRYDFPNRTLLNNAVLFGNNGTSFYFSEVNENINNFNTKYGIARSSPQALAGFEKRSILYSITGTKYLILEKNEKSIPYGFEKFNDYEVSNREYTIYENKFVLPLGFTYGGYISENDYNKLNLAERQSLLLTNAVIHDYRNNDLKYRNDFVFNMENDYKVSFSEHMTDVSESEFKAKKDNAEIIIDFISKPNAENYLMLEDLYFLKEVTSKLEVYLNDESIGKFGIGYLNEQENHQFLINLGKFDNNEKHQLKIIFNDKGTYSFSKIAIVSQNLDYIHESIFKLKESSLKNISVGKDLIKGEIVLDKKKFLCLSIPYSPFWTIYVDGRKVESYKTQEMFIGAFIESGNHLVKIEYKNPFIKAGTTISILGFLLFIFVLFRFKIINVQNVSI